MNIEPFIDVDKFMRDIDIGQADINEAIRQQTSLTAYYGIQHAASEKQLNKIKLLDRTLRAGLGKKVRNMMIMRREKPSAASVDEEVNLDPQARTTAMALIDATEVERICRVAYDAFRTRRDMLVTQGNLRRAEMQTNLQIRDAQDAVTGYHERRGNRQADYRARREATAQPGE